MTAISAAMRDYCLRSRGYFHHLPMCYSAWSARLWGWMTGCSRRCHELPSTEFCPPCEPTGDMMYVSMDPRAMGGEPGSLGEAGSVGSSGGFGVRSEDENPAWSPHFSSGRRGQRSDFRLNLSQGMSLAPKESKISLFFACYSQVQDAASRATERSGLEDSHRGLSAPCEASQCFILNS